MNESKIENGQPTFQQHNVSGWASFAQGFPDENETVWLYNRMNKFVALGCRVWTGGIVTGKQIGRAHV